MAYFTGYTVIKEKDDKNREEASDPDNDSEDDFEGTDFDFLQKPSRQLRQVVQNMRELQFNNGRFVPKGMIRVRGKFDRLFSYPWWMVRVQINTSVKPSNNDKLACKLPSYSYRTDANVGEDILSLVLREGCKVHEQHAARLLEFIRINNLRPTLKDLIYNLEKFGDTSAGEDNKTIAEQIRAALYNSRKFELDCVVPVNIHIPRVLNIKLYSKIWLKKR